jgi:hypothetical protein
MKKPTNADGYQAVLRHFHKDGKAHGAKTRLQHALGVKSRQVVDRWERYGIPMKYSQKLKELTGMRPDEIWPGIANDGSCVDVIVRTNNHCPPRWIEITWY